MQLDVSRDFLDGIVLRQPRNREGSNDLKANGQIHFLPSSPDGTMHTAVVTFALNVGDDDQPFAQGGWRFLFTSSEKFEPKPDAGGQFFTMMLRTGIGKIIAQLNNLCMHANMPLLPIDPSKIDLQSGGETSGGNAPAADGDASTN